MGSHYFSLSLYVFVGRGRTKLWLVNWYVSASPQCLYLDLLNSLVKGTSSEMPRAGAKAGKTPTFILPSRAEAKSQLQSSLPRYKWLSLEKHSKKYIDPWSFERKNKKTTKKRPCCSAPAPAVLPFMGKIVIIFDGAKSMDSLGIHPTSL